MTNSACWLAVLDAVRGEIGRFLIAGAVNTGATYLLYWLLLRVADYRFAYAASYVAGIGMAYWLNCRFVFRRAMSLHGMLQYPIIYVIQFLFGLALIWLLVDRLNCGQRIAMLIVIAANVPLSFILNRHMISRAPAHRRK